MSLAKSVPASIPPSIDPVKIDNQPQLGPYVPATGSQRIESVPRSDGLTPGQFPSQPHYGHGNSSGRMPVSGGAGAPSVPGMGGVLFRRQEIDPHYTDEAESKNFYGKVNNPSTRGMQTWDQGYGNHVFNGKQDVDQAGWQQNSPQQRTSWMHITTPPHGGGYAPESFTPSMRPQYAPVRRGGPVTGTDPYGSGVLNSDTFGAGQTAGGIGGNSYTPAPGGPETQQAAGTDSGMPVWG